jgi:hypothetical protein
MKTVLIAARHAIAKLNYVMHRVACKRMLPWDFRTFAQ